MIQELPLRPKAHSDKLANISKAIIKVMKSVKGMEKNSRVGGNSKYAYDGTKDVDVKEVFNKEMEEAGLCILPTGIEETTQIDRWEESTREGVKQKQSVFTKVKTKYLLIHSESGESIELAGYGHGVDAQDKSAGKATTYALKNCLLLTFLTPVGKMLDTDTVHSAEIEIPQGRQKPHPNNKQFEDFKTRFKAGEDVLDKLKESFTLTKEQNDWINGQIN